MREHVTATRRAVVCVAAVLWAALSAAGWAPLAAQEVAGRLTGKVIDYRDGRSEEQYFVVDALGRPTALEGTRLPGSRRALHDLMGARVRLQPMRDALVLPGAEVRQPVAGLSVEQTVEPARTLGPTPVLTLLCAFPDVAPLARTVAELDVVRNGPFPSAAHFVSLVSQGQASLAGSRTLGWFTMPNPLTHYYASQNSTNVGSGFTSSFTRDLTLAQDCANVAAASGEVLNVAAFSGVDIQLNANLPASYAYLAPVSGFPVGGAITGARRLSVHASWAAFRPGTVAHEYGHTFGLPHAGSIYGDAYDSRWDVMSNSSHALQAATQFRYGTHFNAFHQMRMGWIPASRVVTVLVGQTQTVSLRSHSDPVGSEPLAIRIPQPGSATLQFVIEARSRSTVYDAAIPGEGVIVHQTNSTTSMFIDLDRSGNPNDAGSFLGVGGSYSDATAGFRLQVTGRTGNVWTVVVTPEAPVTITSAASRPGAQQGVAYVDTLRASRSATWTVTGGALPTGLSLAGDGVVSGTPTTAGTFTATVTASAGVASSAVTTDARAFTWVVEPRLPLAIASAAARPSVEEGALVEDTLRSSGGGGASPRWRVVAGALPGGVVLDSLTGIMRGQPLTAGTSRFTVRVTRTGEQVEREFTLEVRPAFLIASGSTLRAATMGAPHADTLRATGRPPRWTVESGTLPSGVQLAPDGTLRGIPTVAGTFAVTLVASVTGANAMLVSRLHPVTLEVRRPVLSAERVRQGVLGGRADALTEDERRYLDLLGNRNGRADAGDVRAWLQQTGTLTARDR